MLKKRIIPCLDVKDGQVVKGIEFRNHENVGGIVELALRYRNDSADELVFYDITASSDNKIADQSWIEEIAKFLDIPFCVAGGIRTIAAAERILAAGADKISINSPALENPGLIYELAKRFGTQCVVIGIDSKKIGDDYQIYQYTGSEAKMKASAKKLTHWVSEVQDRGAGEIVLNCMNQDGTKSGYDLKQINFLSPLIKVPLIASGGAGTKEHFSDLFSATNASGALAASVFHKQIFTVTELKKFLASKLGADKFSLRT